MRRIQTEEEKVAKTIAKHLVNLELDLEMVGRYLGSIVSRVAYNRLRVIAESAEYERNSYEQNNIPEQM